MWNYNFYVYITTNYEKKTLYVGVTNNLSVRLQQHEENKGNNNSFTGKYYCYHLVYYEHFTNINYAIAREKEIKKWSRAKKITLIEPTNPDWLFLNKEVAD